MSFFVFAAGVGGGSAILGTALIGAGVGGAYSAITGDGDILNSMLTGGIIGLGVGGIGTAAGLTGTTALTAPSTLASAPISTALTPTANALTATAPQIAGTGASATGITSGAGAAGGMSATAKGAAGLSALTPAAVTPSLASLSTPVVTGSLLPAGYGAGSAAAGMSGTKMLGYGLAGTAALSLLGGRGKGAGAPADPGMIRPFDYTSTPTAATGIYPSPYATASYDAAGNPIMDTRERNYFDQKFTALEPYSAKIGTVNPNIPLPSSSSVNAANGGIMRNYDDEVGSDNVALDQGNMQKGLFGLGYANGGKTRSNKKDDNFSFDDLTNAQKEYYLDLMASPMKGEAPLGGNVGPENTLEKYMMSQAPQGFSGRIGATRVNDDGSNLRAGLSGIAMAQPGKHGITTMPGAIDVGYRSAKKSEYDPYVDLTAYRSINSMPGKGHAQGINARYTMPFSVGGVTYDPKTQNYSGNQIASAPSKLIMVDEAYPGEMPQGRRMGDPVMKPGTLNVNYANSAMPRLGAENPTTTAYKYAYDALTQKYRQMAQGGATNLGDYSDGGRLLRGPGDGVSDSIPATIANKQPARLADGEFVIPARIVSEIGNGSTDAGAKRLYAMMDKIQAGRKKTIGKKNVAKDTKAKKHLIV